MKKVVKVNENDIENLVRRILKKDSMNEHVDNYIDMEFRDVMGKLDDTNAYPSSHLSKIDNKFNSLSTMDEKKSLLEKLKAILKKKSQIKEDERPRGGLVYGGKAEIIDEVINRINEYGEEYIEQLATLNSGFPSTKYRRIDPEKNIVHAPGIKVQSSVYPK
jgi:hypothetical protein